MKYCSMCGNQLNDNAKFCIACGSKVQEEMADEKMTVQNQKINKELVRCSNCGNVLGANMTVCPVCGAKCDIFEIFADEDFFKDKRKKYFKKKMPRGKKSVREKIEIVIMLILLFVIGFNIYAFSYTSYQTKKLNNLISLCDYDEAEKIVNRLSSDFFKSFMTDDTSRMFATLNEQFLAEKYISEAYSEFKEDYLDDSYTNLPVDATFYYSASDFNNDFGNLGSTDNISDSLAENTVTLATIMEQSQEYNNYIEENKRNVFAEPEHIVLIIENSSCFVDNAGEYYEYDEYAVFTYNSSSGRYVLIGTCDTLDEDAGNLQAWIGVFDGSIIYNTDYDRLEIMETCGAFSEDVTDSYSAMEISTEDDNYTTAEVSTELTTEVTTETPKSESGETAEEAALREELFDEILNKFYNRLENKTVENFMLDYNVPYVDIDYSGDWLEIFSYTFEDVTGDGIDDLWIYSEEARCNVWFTVYNGNIYALSPNTYALINTSMDSMYYREDGTFIRVVAGASSSIGYITYTLYSLSGQGSSMEMVAEEEVEYRFNNISSSGTSVSIDNADEIYYYQWKRYSDGTSTKNDKTITKAEADNYLANYSTNLIEYPSSGYSFSDYDPWE